MKVYVHGDPMYRELGTIRYTVTITSPPLNWNQDDSEGPDPDSMKPTYYHYRTEREAVKMAIDKAGDDFYGCPSVQKEVVTWWVEEDRIAHWEPVGDPIYPV